MKELEARYADLKRRAERVKAIQEVENVFNRYLQYYALQHKEGILSCFAMNEPDVSVEEGYSELFEGAAKVDEYYDAMTRLATKKGILLEQQALCPVIEVAGDGETAKLVCFARGLKGVAMADVQTYVAGRFYVDFKKQADGSWLMWHLHWFLIYDTPVGVGFMFQQLTDNKEWQIPEMADVFTAQANKPSSYWPVIFSPTVPYDYIPEAPDPYDTYDGMTDLKRTRILYHFWDREKYKGR